MKIKTALFWFRRDLRLHDNAGLYRALKANKSVLPIFIFDKNILDILPKKDARVEFIYDTIAQLKNELQELGSDLKVFYSTPTEVFSTLIKTYDIEEVWTNRDYEPYAQQRDREIAEILNQKGIAFKGAKDHVIFEKDEVMKDDGKPYTVYTPYSRKWKLKLNPFYYKAYPNHKYFDALAQVDKEELIELSSMGFAPSGIEFPSKEIPNSIVAKYDETRNIPSIKGTSRLSLHLRFGTVSIRHLVEVGLKKNEKWLNELIWRDFYQMILFHFPHTVDQAFKPAYDRIEWLNDEKQFDLWKAGKTGYPIVDAGMRELNETGFMHNRVRMVVASFLTKHLLIDWRWGERYFAEKLLDFELASNVGGWQWAAGSGCDAAPYFRIFNPASQTQKFDPEWRYIKRWVPEVTTPNYPKPIVDHAYARNRCLESFKKALKE